MKVIDINSSDVKETFENFQKEFPPETLDSVMIVAITKDSRCTLATNQCSGFKKAYMVTYVQAWFNEWQMDRV